MLLGNNNKLENHVVLILGQQGQLTSVQIQEELERQYQKVTLQGINRVTRKLIREGVLMKEKYLFSLRMPWVFDLARLAEDIQETYLNPKYIESFLPTNPAQRRSWNFSSFAKLNDFWTQLLITIAAQSKDKVMLGWMPHPWFNLIQKKREEQYLNGLSDKLNKSYVIVGGGSFLDKKALSRWSSHKLDCYMSEGQGLFGREADKYITVIDSMVTSITFDKETSERINNLYNRVQSEQELKEENLLDLFTQPIKAKLVVEKNHEKAKQYANKFTKIFGILSNKKPINEFYDIKHFPPEQGILVVPSFVGKDIESSLKISTYKQYVSDTYGKILRTTPDSKAGANFVYFDALGSRGKSTHKSRMDFMQIVLSHKQSVLKWISSEKHYIGDAFAFDIWEQVCLSLPDFATNLEKLRQIYKKDRLFRKYIAQDSKKLRTSQVNSSNEQAEIILEQILFLYLAVKGQVTFKNNFINGHEKWVLVSYPDTPFKSLIYLHQKQFLGLENPQNKYEQAWYDLSSKKLYEFDRVDLETIEL